MTETPAMTFANHYLSLLQPLSPGNVLNVALQVYRRHFKAYLRVAVVSTLWGALPILSAILLGLLWTTLSPPATVLALLIPAWFVLLLFCVAKALATGAALLRLVFGELLQMPETPQQAQRFTRSRQWSFLGTTALVSILLITLLTLLYSAMIAVTIALVGIFSGLAVLGGLGANASNPILFLLVGGAFVGLLLVFLLSFLWVSVRLTLSDVPLAIEADATVTSTIGRSWELTQRQFWRILLILAGAFLMTLPVSFTIQLIAAIAQGLIIMIDSSGEVMLSILSALIGWAIGLFAGAVLFPFWQAIRATLYFDLRNRQEGLGLVLPPRQDRAIAPPRLFHQVSILTPESVALEFTLAGLGNRTLALVIDYQLLTLLLGGFWMLWLLLSTQLMAYLSGLDGDFSQVPLWLLAIALLVSFTIYNGYFIYFETTQQGRTPGKRLTHTRVIREDGRPVGLSQAVMRSLLRPIDDLFFIGMFLILFSPQEKRLGDRVAGTLVIQEEATQRPVSITCSDQGKALAQQLPQVSQVSRLLPDEFAVVRAYLQRRDRLFPKARQTLSMTLAAQVQALIQLETLPPDVLPDHVLEAVYLAYQDRPHKA